MMTSLMRRWWKSLWSGRTRPIRRQSRPALHLECLEDRACPTLNLIHIDIAAGPFSSYPSNGDARSFVEYNGHLYFAANSNDGAGFELHRYDPSSHTVIRVTDINNGPGNSNPAWLTVYNNVLYFAAYDETNGYELWSYDGTTASLVADINSGAGNSNPAWLTVYNGKLYFAANDGTNGKELWSYDGTTPPNLVTDINSGAGFSNPAWLTVYNNVLYFAADDGTSGVELWSYDGTTASLVADINSADNSNPAWLTVYNNVLYFAAYDETNGYELWSYDGTTASLVADINSGAGNSNPAWLTVYNSVLYFAADDGTNGYELWSYDGTTASLVADINSADNSNPAWLTVYNNVLYFAAYDETNGYELWSYDGTTASLVADINSADNSNPGWLTVFNNSLFFNAYDGSIGYELWILYDQQPVSLTITGGGQLTVVNTAFANPITVTVLDQYNNPVGSGYTVTFAPPGLGASASFAGGLTYTTDALGQVVVNTGAADAVTANTVAGTYTVNVSVIGGSNPTGTFSLTNLPGAPASVVVDSGGNQSTTVNTAFSTSIQITVRDAFGNPVPNSPVAFFLPSGGASGTLTGGPVGFTDANGQIIKTLTANTVAGTYSIVVQAVGGANPTAVISSLTNLPDVPDSITISGGGQSTVVNTAFGGPITVTVLDQYGNAVGSGYTVTFAPPGSGASANFPGGPFTTNASGQVSVTPTANTVAGTYTVNVSVSGGSNLTGTFSLTNLPGAPASVVVGSGGNQSTTVNTAFSTPIQITVRDAFGNPVPNSAVAFVLPSVGASGTLSGGSAGFTDANGRIITTLTANTVAGTYSIVVQAVGGANPTAVISSLTNLPGPVAQIAYLAPVPSSVLVNSPIKPPVRVILQDQYGNRVYQSGVQVRLTLRKANNTNSPNLLGGPVTVTTNAQGLAKFVGLTITAPGTYKFRARVLNISGIPVILSNPFRVV
jgi:ELWxxDGT repeat protein